MPERVRVRAKDVTRHPAETPRPWGPRQDERDDGIAVPSVEVEIKNMTHVLRETIPGEGDAIEIASTLREMVFDRLHLFWRVQRGDYPLGQRIPAPTLRAWIVTDPAAGASDRPADVETSLGEAGAVIAAIKALCLPKAAEAELRAAERIWDGYRFSDLIRACRAEVAALTVRIPEVQCSDPKEP